MGLFDWLKQELLSAVSPSGPERLSRRNEKTRPELALATSVGDSSLIQLAGTTTNSKEAAVALVQRHQLTDRVALHVTGTLQREPENPYEPGAVAVLVEGEPVPLAVERDNLGKIITSEWEDLFSRLSGHEFGLVVDAI